MDVIAKLEISEEIKVRIRLQKLTSTTGFTASAVLKVHHLENSIRL